VACLTAACDGCTRLTKQQQPLLFLLLLLLLLLLLVLLLQVLSPSAVRCCVCGFPRECMCVMLMYLR
jgi:hypothetical protein